MQSFQRWDEIHQQVDVEFDSLTRALLGGIGITRNSITVSSVIIILVTVVTIVAAINVAAVFNTRRIVLPIHRIQLSQVWIHYLA